MGSRETIQLSVGNAIIDPDHKNLIVVLNRVEDAIRARNRAALIKAFELLETYMRIHTQNEEKIAKSDNYSFARIRFGHQQLINNIWYKLDKLKAVDGVWPESVASIYSALPND